MKTKQEYITEEEKKEKYIEDVKKQLGCSYDCCLSCYTYARKNCTLRPQAEALYAAGYRKASDVIDELVERVKERALQSCHKIINCYEVTRIETVIDDIAVEMRREAGE